MNNLPSQRPLDQTTPPTVARRPVPSQNGQTFETYPNPPTRPTTESFDTHPFSPTLNSRPTFATYASQPTPPLHSRSAGHPSAGMETFDPRTVASAPDASWAPHMVPVDNYLAAPTILDPSDPRAAAAQTILTGSGPIIGSDFGSGGTGGSPYYHGQDGNIPQQQGAEQAAGAQRKRGCWSRRSTCAKWTIALTVIGFIGIGAAVGGIFAGRGSVSKDDAAAGNSTSTDATSTYTSALPTGTAAAGALKAGAYPVTVSKVFDNCTTYGLPCGDDILSGTWTFQNSGSGYTYTGADGFKAPVTMGKDADGKTHMAFKMANDVSYTYDYLGSTCTAQGSVAGVAVPDTQTSFNADVGKLINLCGEQDGNACFCEWKGFQA
jgi:hypothetical protein